MLIVSDFHDYYDTASMYGIDKTCVFQRKEIMQEKFRSKARDNENLRVNGGDSLTVEYFVVGFCGKLYPLVHTKLTEKGCYTPEEEMYFYDPKELTEYLTEKGAHFVRTRRYGWGYYYGSPLKSIKGIQDYFDPKTHEPEMQHLFLAHKCPVFLVNGDRRTLTLFAQLKKHKFMKVKDAPTAFQEIYQYLSGVLGTPEKPMVKVSDENKAKKYGHNDKYSFKKLPGGGRWR